jgi:hypothetical protein
MAMLRFDNAPDERENFAGALDDCRGATTPTWSFTTSASCYICAVSVSSGGQQLLAAGWRDDRAPIREFRRILLAGSCREGAKISDYLSDLTSATGGQSWSSAR